MIATPKRSGRHVSGSRRPRPLPFADRLATVRRLEAGLADDYAAERTRTDYDAEAYAWRVRILVPAYDQLFSLRIELSTYLGSSRVVVEDWTGEKLKHTFGGNSLCMWFPSDPPERKWNIGHDALLRLVDLAIAHLFKELYWREHHEWLGEEAPHEAPKVETSEKPPSLDAGRRGFEITSRMSGRV